MTKRKSSIGRSLLLTASILCTSIGASTASAQSLLEFLSGGNRLEYVGRAFDEAENITRFRYQLVREGLLSNPLSSLELILPEGAVTDALQQVNADASHIVSLDASENGDKIKFSGFPLLSPTADIELVLTGDVPAGTIPVQAKLGSNSPFTQGSILGPISLGINQPGGGGSPQPTPAPTPIIDNIPCIPDGLPIIAEVGERLNFDIPLPNSSNSPLTIQYENFPIDIGFSVPPGGNLLSGESLSIDFTPDASEVGDDQIFPIKIITDGFERSCNVVIDVVENDPPTLNTDAIAENYQCQGIVTTINLDASASFDPEGNELTYTWSQNCQGGDITPNGAQATLRLTLPGSGTAQSCQVTLEASDGSKTSSANLPIAVAACDVNCAQSQKDSCGVCNGQNLCIDCSGQPFGNQAVDRCGVCGGTNECVDCRGAAQGNAQLDSCGICEGDNSCRACNSVSLQSTVADLNSTVLTQSRVITRLFREIKRLGVQGSILKKAQQIRKQANELYTGNLTLVSSLNSTDLVCSNYVGCASVSTSGATAEFEKTALQLRKLGQTIVRLIRKSEVSDSRRTAAELRKKVRRSYRKSIAAIKLYPKETHTCQ